MRIEAEEVSKRLHGDLGAGKGIILGDCLLQKYFGHGHQRLL